MDPRLPRTKLICPPNHVGAADLSKPMMLLSCIFISAPFTPGNLLSLLTVQILRYVQSAEPMHNSQNKCPFTFSWKMWTVISHLWMSEATHVWRDHLYFTKMTILIFLGNVNGHFTHLNVWCHSCVKWPHFPTKMSFYIFFGKCALSFHTCEWAMPHMCEMTMQISKSNDCAIRSIRKGTAKTDDATRVNE